MTGPIKRACRPVITGTGFIALAFFLVAALSAGPAHAFTAATLGDYGNVTVMEVSGGYDAHNPDGTNNSVPREEIAKEFYRLHKNYNSGNSGDTILNSPRFPVSS